MDVLDEVKSGTEGFMLERGEARLDRGILMRLRSRIGRVN